MKEVEAFAVGDRIKWLSVLPGMDTMTGTIIAPFFRYEKIEQAMCSSNQHEEATYPIWTVQFDAGQFAINWTRPACCQRYMEKIEAIQ